MRNFFIRKNGSEFLSKEDKVKLKITALFIVLVTAIVLFSNSFQSNIGYDKDKVVTKLVYSGLQRWHYADKRVDTTFSENAFKEYLDSQDSNKRFLLKSDIEELKKFQDKVGDQFIAGKMELVNLTSQIMDKRIKQVMGFYEDILSKPFNYNIPETIEFDQKKLSYPANEAELKDSWRKALKYSTLIRYIQKLEENNSLEKEKRKTEKEIEEESRKTVLKSFKSIFNRLLQGNQKDALSRYINSMLQVYDPHSIYFAPVDKQSFDMEMSGSFEGIGATLQNEDEYVKVVHIVPGGPAWKQKQLQVGDKILKVAQGNDEPLDIIGMRTDEAVQYIRGKKGTLVRLTVKKPDNRIVEIPIVRDVVILEETFAKSAILKDNATGKTVGYIHLPGFYDDFTGTGGRNSTTDVKAELEKLKAHNVSGIILDLRNNTGGALLDAVNMSGLFLPKGPIVQVKDKRDKIEALEDKDSTITYEGPLIVLVNQLSASASEILSAALQDYNRAIIVGSNSYGKGTVQAMLNLDRFNYDSPDKEKNLGALTITIQQFFRITGLPIQTKGVTPDIKLPDRFDSVEIGEKFLDYALKGDMIPSASFTKWTTVPLLDNEVIERSKTRVQASPGFVTLNEYIDNVKKIRENTLQSLRLDDMMKLQAETKKESEKLDKSNKELSILSVIPSAPLPKKDSESLEKIARDLQDDWFKSIKSDLVLGEAVQIMNDVINLEKKK